MTLTEVNKILTELGLFKVDSKFPEYYHEYCFNSPIFEHQPGHLVRVEGLEEFTSNGIKVHPLEETKAHLRFFYYINPSRYSDYWVPAYHFMNWQDKTLDELSERWLRRMTKVVVDRIHKIETGEIKRPVDKGPHWGDLPVKTDVK